MSWSRCKSSKVSHMLSMKIKILMKAVQKLWEFIKHSMILPRHKICIYLRLNVELLFKRKLNIRRLSTSLNFDESDLFLTFARKKYVIWCLLIIWNVKRKHRIWFCLRIWGNIVSVVKYNLLWFVHLIFTISLSSLF